MTATKKNTEATKTFDPADRSYDAFLARLAVAGLLDSMPEAARLAMAHEQGFETPTTASAEIIEYTPQATAKRKNPQPNLYAKATAVLNGKTTQVGYVQISKLSLEIRKAKLAVQALEALASQVSEGKAPVPAGWAIAPQATENGFTPLRLETK